MNGQQEINDYKQHKYLLPNRSGDALVPGILPNAHVDDETHSDPNQSFQFVDQDHEILHEPVSDERDVYEDHQKEVANYPELLKLVV